MKRLLQLALLLVALAWCAPAQAKAFPVASGTLCAALDTGADPTCTIPAGAQANDIMWIITWTRNTSNTTVITDFTEAAQGLSSTGDYRLFWKRHDGSETNPVINRTGTTGDVYARIFVTRNNIASGNPYNAIGSFQFSGSEPITLTGITTGAANSTVAMFGGYEDDDLASFTCAATDPSSLQVVYAESTTGADGSIEYCYEFRAGAAGATGNVTVDFNGALSDQFGGILVSMDPVTCSGVCYEQDCTAAVASGTTFSCQLPVKVTNQNVIASGAGWANTTPALNSIITSSGCGTVTLTLVNNPTAQTGEAAMGYGIATATGLCTVTATISVASGFQNVISVQEISGVNTTTPLDNSLTAMQGQASPGTGANAVTSGTVTTTVNGDYLFGFTYGPDGSSETLTAGTNFTLNVPIATSWAAGSEYRYQATAAAGTAATFTIGTNHAHITGLMPFQPVAAGGGGGPIGSLLGGASAISGSAVMK